jgi:hypothetical protein
MRLGLLPLLLVVLDIHEIECSSTTRTSAIVQFAVVEYTHWRAGYGVDAAATSSNVVFRPLAGKALTPVVDGIGNTMIGPLLGETWL